MGGAQKCSFLFCEFMLLNQTWVCSPAHNKASLLTQGCDGSESCSVVSPWTVARQAALSMGFSRQEYWSGLPFPSPGNLPNPGTEPRSPALQVDSLPSEPPGKPQESVHCRDQARRTRQLKLKKPNSPWLSGKRF